MEETEIVRQPVRKKYPKEEKMSSEYIKALDKINQVLKGAWGFNKIAAKKYMDIVNSDPDKKSITFEWAQMYVGYVIKGKRINWDLLKVLSSEAKDKFKLKSAIMHDLKDL